MVRVGIKPKYMPNKMLVFYRCDILLDIIDNEIEEKCSHKYVGTFSESYYTGPFWP
jgi:hypothetical protein